MIDEKKLIKEIKNYLIGLIDNHKEHVEITKFNVEIQNIINALPKVGEWIPVEERYPNNNDYVLLSFSNMSGVEIGRYEEDEEGGAFYLGDEDVSCSSQYIFVNAWMPLPEPYKESED